MGFSLQKLEDEPIILLTYLPDFDVMRDAPLIIQQTIALLNASHTPVYHISDTRSLHIPFEDILKGIAMATQGRGSLLRHPNIALALIIPGNQYVRVAAEALIQARFRVEVMESVEEALRLARADLKLDHPG